MGKTEKQNQSSFKKRTKALCDKTALLSEAREESLSKIKRETSKGRADTHELLHDFRRDREKLSEEQRENLRQETARRRQHVAAMLSGFRKRAEPMFAIAIIKPAWRGKNLPQECMETASKILQTKVSKDK